MTGLGYLADLTVEVGFGVNAVGGDYFVLDDPVRGELNNTTYLLAPTTVFVDVTEHVAAISTDRGRERELDEYGTGGATVVFNDDDRTFDPAYSASPYYGQITPMRRITITWRNYPLFTGWIHDWSVTYEPGDNLSRVTAKCLDGFAILANQELAEIDPADHAGDLSGERISRVLDLPEVNYPPSRSIDDGNSILGATTFGGNALAYLQRCSRAEAGYLFIAADGTLTFRERTATLNVPADVVFSDDRTAGIPYRNITQRSAADLLYTRVTATSETTNNEVVAYDAEAAAEFLVLNLALGTLLTADDDQTQNLVDYYLERFSTPEIRFQTATINIVGLDEADVETLVALELTDVVTVQRSPLNVGDTIERLSIIDGIDHTITPRSWTTGLAFANADGRAFLMLNDTMFGILDANRLAF